MNSRSTCCATHTDGFSLIEMLVCLILMGTTLTFVVAASGQWIRIQDRGKSELASVESLALAIEALHFDIERSNFVPSGLDRNVPLLKGSSRELTLFGNGTRRELAVHYQPSGLGGLERHERIMQANRSLGLERKDTLLPPGFTVRFEYVDGNDVVTNEWSSKEYPKLVRVGLSWLWSGKERHDLVELLLPNNLPVICAQANSLSGCKQLLQQGSNFNSYGRTPIRASRSRRGI